MVLALAGCASNPLAARESDFARRLAPERTRAIEPMDLTTFKAAAPGATDSAAQAARLAALEKLDLTLAQVRASALSNNLTLRTVLIDPTIAQQDVNVEAAKFDAVFTPSASFSGIRSGAINDKSSSSDLRARQGSLGAGVSVPLRSGGRANVDLVTRVSENDPAFVGTGQSYQTDATFSIVQPLLRGFGREVNNASIRVAGYNQQIVESRTKLEVINQLAQADRAYWQLYAARRELQVRQQEYELASEQLSRAQRRVQAGDSPELEQIRAESGLASRLEAIITAETSVLTQQRELKRLMNMPGADVDSRTALIPATDPSLVEYDLDQAKLLDLALASRMELLETELALLADDANITVARNGTLPGLDLSASYTFSGSGDTPGNDIGTISRSRYGGLSASLVGNIPIGNEAAEARLRRALLTRLQRIGTHETRRQTVRQDVLDAIDRVQSGWQRVLAARQASILAGRTLVGEQRQFDVGSRTSTDVLDAASRLSAAQSSEVRAIADYQIAQIDLAVATGTILGAASVSFEPTGDSSVNQSELQRAAQLELEQRQRILNAPVEPR
jgi:outer membrane protein TolC